MSDVGLDYVNLDRESATLAGGEAQRIHLATQIGSGLVGVMYVLDEPTIGLHQRDNDRLLKTLDAFAGHRQYTWSSSSMTTPRSKRRIGLSTSAPVRVCTAVDIVAEGPLQNILQ